MAKGKATVSQDFAKFYGKNQSAIEEAKKAENSMSSGPCPVGWEGQAILLEAAAEQGKDKKDDKGNVKPGNPRIRMKFGIIGDPLYQGKTFQKFWIFNDSANASAMDRFEWFLNDCEAMGLPNEIRKNHSSPDELLEWFVASEDAFDVQCVSDDYARDKKAMKVAKPASALDSSTSMVPGGNGDATVTSPPSPGIGVDAKVKFLGNTWTVEEVKGDQLVISRMDGANVRSREVPVSAVTVE